jgi:hypothetical protein
MPAHDLTLLPGRYAVCLLTPTAPIPPWANGGDFCAITRTGDELSIICSQELLPEDVSAAALAVARDWLLLRVEGPLAFDMTGVAAALSVPLAQAGVALLVVATYQTDYLLVKAEQAERAITALTEAGHRVTI